MSARTVIPACLSATDHHLSGEWKKAAFKQYNFAAEGASTQSGALHPLMKVREEFRNIFFEMGYVSSGYASSRRCLLTRHPSFEEMPTNRFVESSFWCFDTLFVPQQHPARDLQDTFYLKGEPRHWPSSCRAPDSDLPPQIQSRLQASPRTTTSASSKCTSTAAMDHKGTGTLSRKKRPPGW